MILLYSRYKHEITEKRNNREKSVRPDRTSTRRGRGHVASVQHHPSRRFNKNNNYPKSEEGRRHRQRQHKQNDHQHNHKSGESEFRSRRL